jgi:hypothetical protein
MLGSVLLPFGALHAVDADPPDATKTETALGVALVAMSQTIGDADGTQRPLPTSGR